MDDKPNPLSFVLPGLLSALALIQAVAYGATWARWMEQFAYAAGCILGGWTVIEVARYLGYHFSDLLKGLWDARYRLSLNYLAEMMTRMDKSALSVLRLFGAPTWWVRESPNGGGPDYLLFGTDGMVCRLEFVRYVIERSSQTHLYPQRMFGDQSYRFDPYREVTDRQQYMAFERWLYMTNKAEWHSANQSARFTHGWTPAKLREVLDLDAFTFTDEQANNGNSVVLREL